MKRWEVVLSLAVVLAAATSCPASQERLIAWQSLRLDFGEVEKAGRVTAEIKTGEAGYDKFVVRAFSKSYALTRKQLATLKGFPLKSLWVTAEPGYKRTGGYTVHFRLRQNVYRQTDRQARRVVCISVNAAGLTVSPVRGVGSSGN
jgi:hypothetical protein